MISLRSSLGLIASLTLALPMAAEGAQVAASPTDTTDGTGEAAKLDVSIQFLAPQLTTIVSDQGTDFVGVFFDHSLTYPPSLYGSYPGYFIGTTMRFQVTITNTTTNGNKTFKLTVRAASNAINSPDGSDGVAIGTPQEWSVTDLGPGQTQVITGQVDLTGSDIPIGLDVTRISVFHPNDGAPTAGLIKVQTGVWCPPPAAPTSNN
jgi:hypothetical protein